MNHRHVHKRRHKKRLRYYAFIVVFLLVFIGLISYYKGNKRQPAWNDEYLLSYNSELNRDMGNGSGGLFTISQGTPMDKDVEDYELIVQNEITGIIQGFYVSSESNPFGRLFGTQWEGLYIQSAMRLADDISWDEFEDVIEPFSDGNEMFASNSNIEQADVSSNPPPQDQEENIETGVPIPSEEDLEAIRKQLAYNIGGGSIPGFTGGVPGSIGYGPAKSNDYPNGGEQKPPSDSDNNPVPVPEPSTLVLAGSGLILLLRRIYKSTLWLD